MLYRVVSLLPTVLFACTFGFPNQCAPWISFAASMIAVLVLEAHMEQKEFQPARILAEQEAERNYNQSTQVHLATAGNDGQNRHQQQHTKVISHCQQQTEEQQSSCHDDLLIN